MRKITPKNTTKGKIEMSKKYSAEKKTQAELDKAEASKPTGYNAENGKKAERISNGLLLEKTFTYDPKTDATFAAAKREKTAAAKQAMNDTLAASSALTGGYGNSWGSVAAQREYDRVMEGVADIIPELYDAAYRRYEDSRSDRFKLLEDSRKADNENYSRFRDDVKDWKEARDYYYQLVRDDIEDQKDADKLEVDIRGLINDMLRAKK